MTKRIIADRIDLGVYCAVVALALVIASPILVPAFFLGWAVEGASRLVGRLK